MMQAVSYSEWQTQQILYEDRKTKIQLIRLNDRQLVRKTTNLNVVEKKYADHELKFMMGISHPNVVTYINHQKIDNGKTKLLQIYMPYYANSDLQTFLSKHDPPFQQRMRMLIDVLVGLQQLHSRFIIHRDLKLKNIFVSGDRRCVIADLGISTTSIDSANSEVGTFCYNAPQIYSRESYNEKVDVWAMGIIAYQLFNARNGQIPFPFIQPQKMLEKINTYGQYIDYNSYIVVTSQLQHCNEGIPIQIQTMIERMLQNDPKKRISWTQFYGEGLLARYDIGDRLCTFKGEYAMMQDKKITYKHSFKKISKFMTTMFEKLRHILSREHRHYFEAKYPILKQEIQAVNRVYLKLLRDCAQFYKQMKEKRIYKYGSKLKPFYKAVAQQLSDIELTVRHWDKNEKQRSEDYDSNDYFHQKYKMITEMIDDMDKSDFKNMERI